MRSMIPEAKKDEIIETLNEIYTPFGVGYLVATGVLLIDSPT